MATPHTCLTCHNDATYGVEYMDIRPSPPPDGINRTVSLWFCDPHCLTYYLTHSTSGWYGYVSKSIVDHHFNDPFPGTNPPPIPDALIVSGTSYFGDTCTCKALKIESCTAGGALSSDTNGVVSCGTMPVSSLSSTTPGLAFSTGATLSCSTAPIMTTWTTGGLMMNNTSGVISSSTAPAIPTWSTAGLLMNDTNGVISSGTATTLSNFNFGTSCIVDANTFTSASTGGFDGGTLKISTIRFMGGSTSGTESALCTASGTYGTIATTMAPAVTSISATTFYSVPAMTLAATSSALCGVTGVTGALNYATSAIVDEMTVKSCTHGMASNEILTADTDGLLALTSAPNLITVYATTCNATTCNATTLNATTCNATTLNATTMVLTSCSAAGMMVNTASGAMSSSTSLSAGVSLSGTVLGAAAGVMITGATGAVSSSTTLPSSVTVSGALGGSTSGVMVTASTGAMSSVTNITFPLSADYAYLPIRKTWVASQKRHCWFDPVWSTSSTTTLYLYPKSSGDGAPWIGVITDDGKYIENTSAKYLTATLVGGAGNNIDELSIVSPAAYRLYAYSNAGTLGFKFFYMPKATISNFNNGTNTYTISAPIGIGAMFAQTGAQLVHWVDSSHWATPYAWQNGGAITEDLANFPTTMTVVSATSGTVVISVTPGYYSNTGSIWLVSGFKPCKYDGTPFAYPYCDTGISAAVASSVLERLSKVGDWILNLGSVHAVTAQDRAIDTLIPVDATQVFVTGQVYGTRSAGTGDYWNDATGCGFGYGADGGAIQLSGMGMCRHGIISTKVSNADGVYVRGYAL